jgi:hypothetical protein
MKTQIMKKIAVVEKVLLHRQMKINTNQVVIHSSRLVPNRTYGFEWQQESFYFTIKDKDNNAIKPYDNHYYYPYTSDKVFNLSKKEILKRLKDYC